MLVVARQEGKVRSPALDAAAPAVADRGADAAALVVADDDGRAVRTGLVAGPVRGAVVDDDRLEPAVPGHLVEDAADLPGLVQGGDDHGDDRLGGRGRVHGQSYPSINGSGRTLPEPVPCGNDTIVLVPCRAAGVLR